jgi:FlaA1/EpsC-like NDP-sugar epimerase
MTPSSGAQRHPLAGTDTAALAADVALFLATPFLAYTVRNEAISLQPHGFTLLATYAVTMTVLRVAANARAGAYRALWRYASTADLARLVYAIALTSVAAVVVGGFAVRVASPQHFRLPLVVILLDCAFAAAATATPKVWRRVLGGVTSGGTPDANEPATRTLIVGAGALGQLLLQDLRSARSLHAIVPVGFVDDDPAKLDRRLGGVPVVGAVRDLRALIVKHDAALVIIAVRNAGGRLTRDVFDAASAAGVKVQLLPAPSELAAGTRTSSLLRTIDIDDLLRRPRVATDLTAVSALHAGKSVMITGAGGSIGSELARQCARFGPSTLVVLDHSEDGVYRIHRELTERHPELHVVPVVADLREAALVEQRMRAHRPDVIYHAAAYKHVPMMEMNRAAAIANNVGTTRVLLDLAVQLQLPRVVIISSDKAVHPSSLMGATKRVTELLMRRANTGGTTIVSAVRFGNVLGSRGSVVPLFLDQIQQQRRITVTDPRMTRFFMAISEAVELVLQSSVLAQSGDLFILDMGTPIKITDLAHDLIRLSGLTPEEDVQIVYTGLRPGEKLHEALATDGETIEPTAHPSVLRVARDAEWVPTQREALERLLERLAADSYSPAVEQALRELLPDYREPAPGD